ncbi:D-galactarate dehydratase / Altronate hydrolase, C terminus [Acididesulfobacillus acetoxydans]|uniref:Altronate hydrolase n=1 Tax=Acididesulfobacillus acetoxydans TaxID=1561005 RepID=A0A8S0WIC2_9FIRM|nr:altronate dehydratase family protein [Acididesulfobacillus acetoxydans]CAA7603242.1 D-galactarate dehydratase / Altronate hydrolase, C terminus [Acididesulfobacillus acetoxydans]CEJ06043.1 Altronate hydrolase [Acididesulfobacillus acetoxydans]
MELLRLNDADNVAVALRDLKKGETVRLGSMEITLLEDVPGGHKVAVSDIAERANVVKYGFPIGQATKAIRGGEWVHTHNTHTNLAGTLSYQYAPGYQERNAQTPSERSKDTFWGYRREDGRVGIRNEIWIVPTVSCVNRVAELIAREAREALKDRLGLDGVFEFKHPYGCSQMGEDQLRTQQILADLIQHPNAAGVLVLGLGCENSNVGEIKKVLGDYNEERVKFLVAQEVEDELAAGVEIVRKLADYAERFQREKCPVSELTIGLKCGGSDGFSGITANPLVGAFSDRLTAAGGATVLTEVPEMFGAETLLMNRAVNEEVFAKTVRLVNDFKDYYASYKQPIYENPSPGNKKGGITTLEDKSLGCTQKGGTSEVVDVLDYAGRVMCRGLNLLAAPGNDMVAATALAAAGCQMVLFTTGRGTPLGTCVPTVKVSTNSGLYQRKSHWIDFDAGVLLNGTSMEDLADDFWKYVLRVASGEATKAENLGFRDIAIFKNGVTL